MSSTDDDEPGHRQWDRDTKNGTEACWSSKCHDDKNMAKPNITNHKAKQKIMNQPESLFVTPIPMSRIVILFWHQGKNSHYSLQNCCQAWFWSQTPIRRHPKACAFFGKTSSRHRLEPPAVHSVCWISMIKLYDSKWTPWTTRADKPALQIGSQ